MSEEVSEIPGVQGVEVELASGRLTVQSEAPVDPAQVRSAVEEAGYAVTS